MSGNLTELVDILTVDVDATLSETERLIEYLRQIGDYKNFRCGQYIFRVIYPEDAQHINDCLRGAIV
jgi:hypothetical protein